jgi:predicted alpha-1,2-mannosidase
MVRTARLLPALVMLATAFPVAPSVPLAARGPSGLTQYVDPFIGTKPAPDTGYGFGFDTGDVWPGAAYPNGMLYWSPDTDDDQHRNQAGGYWRPQPYIKGFSLTHFSGRGCNVYQDLPILPENGAFTRSTPPNRHLYDSDLRQAFSHSNETARPGYYQVGLDSGIGVELTVTPRTGLGRFTFPAEADSTLLLSSAGSINQINGAGTRIDIDPQRQLVAGSASAGVGCPASGTAPYTVYFALQFDRPFKAYGTWSNDTVDPGSTSSTGDHSGGWLTFDTSGNSGQTIQVKPAISYVSLDAAMANIQAEDPSWDFNAIAAAADSAWNQTLAKVKVSGGGKDDLTIFYTAVYHCFFHPNLFDDSDGAYMGMDNQVHSVAPGHHQYQMIPGWDGYRSHIRLLAMIAPGMASDIVQSLVNDALQGGGGMPRWEQANRNSNGMVGDSPAAYVSSAYAMGARDFDTAAAFRALDLAGSVPGTRSDGHLVRGGLNEWIQAGYLSGRPSESYEYSNDDFGLAMFAQALGEGFKHDYYLARSFNWKNTFNRGHGYVQSRNADGTWKEPFDPGASRDGMVEGNAAQYTWMLPFDHKGVFDEIRASGQDPVLRLDDFFTQLNAGPNRPYMWIGNEPSLNSPWEYDFIGAPSKAQKFARDIEVQAFLNGPDGLPGNDDGGATSSWYVLAALGIYPAIPGVGGVVVGSPLFQDAVMDVGGGRSVHIIGRNASRGTPYVQSLRVNGKEWSSPWIDWSLLAGGGELDFTLGATATDWGSDPAQAPPSWDGDPPGPPSYDSLRDAFNNPGVSDDAATTTANYDHVGYSYSLQALAAQGIVPGGTVSFNGVDFTWPDWAPSQVDNAESAGQVIRIGAQGARLAFLGSATSGPSEGTAVVTYADGTTQEFTLGFSDWTLNGGTRDPLPYNSIVATMPYRNGTAGQQARVNHAFYMEVALDPGQSVASIRLARVGAGILHIFALAVSG